MARRNEAVLTFTERQLEVMKQSKQDLHGIWGMLLLAALWIRHRYPSNREFRKDIRQFTHLESPQPVRLLSLEIGIFSSSHPGRKLIRFKSIAQCQYLDSC